MGAREFVFFVMLNERLHVGRPLPISQTSSTFQRSAFIEGACAAASSIAAVTVEDIHEALPDVALQYFETLHTLRGCCTELALLAESFAGARNSLPCSIATKGCFAHIKTACAVFLLSTSVHDGLGSLLKASLTLVLDHLHPLALRCLARPSRCIINTRLVLKFPSSCYSIHLNLLLRSFNLLSTLSIAFVTDKNDLVGDRVNREGPVRLILSIVESLEAHVTV